MMQKKKSETNGNDMETTLSLSTSQMVLVEVDMFKYSVKSSNIYCNTAVQN